MPFWKFEAMNHYYLHKEHASRNSVKAHYRQKHCFTCGYKFGAFWRFVIHKLRNFVLRLFNKEILTQFSPVTYIHIFQKGCVYAIVDSKFDILLGIWGCKNNLFSNIDLLFTFQLSIFSYFIHGRRHYTKRILHAPGKNPKKEKNLQKVTS